MNDASGDLFDLIGLPQNSTNLDFANFAVLIAELTAELLADKKVDKLVALD